MNLESIRVRNYRSIDDTGWVSVDDLTCLIGKNESGKTAFMEAVETLNPTYGDGSFAPYEEYPRRRWPDYKDRMDENPDPVVSARFELEAAEHERLSDRIGGLEDDTVVVTKDYADEYHWDVAVDEAAYVETLLAERDMSSSAREELGAAASLEELRSKLQETEESGTAVEALRSDLAEGSLATAPGEAARELLESELPEFRYVGEYDTLDGAVDLESVAGGHEEGEMSTSDEAFLALLSVADLDLDSLRDDDDWREYLTDLERASGKITGTVMEYWSQTDNLKIHIRPDEGRSESGRSLRLRVENLQHDVTVSFEQRSRGFRWFFSTFCQIYDLLSSDDEIVLMLDEPGLHLHPKAKQDFLRFLGDEVAGDHTILYTTHSPFMIETDLVHRTKMIQKSPESGSTVLSDAEEADEYTRFPLQSVFELDVMKTLLARSQVLLVQHPAAHAYLYNVSELMEVSGEDGIDYRWTVLPVGNAENVTRFVSLFGSQDLDTTVLFEGGADPEEYGFPSDVIVKSVGEYAPDVESPAVEDLLSEQFYLEVVNRAYAGELSAAGMVPDRLEPATLPSSDESIVRRLEAFFDSNGLAGGFDRSVPADYLQAHREEFVDELDIETKRTFGTLSKDFDGILDSVSDPSRSESSFLGGLFGD
jgi:hypothetical protein